MVHPSMAKGEAWQQAIFTCCSIPTGELYTWRILKDITFYEQMVMSKLIGASFTTELTHLAWWCHVGKGLQQVSNNPH